MEHYFHAVMSQASPPFAAVAAFTTVFFFCFFLSLLTETFHCANTTPADEMPFHTCVILDSDSPVSNVFCLSVFF